MIEDIENTTPTPHTKYAVLSMADYFKLNEAISKAKGYKLGEKTARYSSVNPSLCKINIVFDEVNEVETYDLACIMRITTEVQEKYPELLPVLLERTDVIKAEETIDSIIVEDFTTEQTDYLLQHYDAVGIKGLDVIQSDAIRSTLSDEAVDNLINSGTTVITKEIT